MALEKSIPWWLPKIGTREQDVVKEVLQTGYVNEGDYTARFEGEIARRLGVKYAVATSSGTAALFIALRSAGIGPGDEVIVPDLTFIATANAVSLTGARPVLVDVDPRTLNISVEASRRAITEKTRAIVPVHVSGRAADMPSILTLAEQHNLRVVEDAAEALLSRSQGKFLGTFGCCGCFSFSPNKTITTGQGGMVVTNDDQLVVRLRELKDQGRPVRGTGGDDIHHSIGYNFKLTNLQAAVGIGQLYYLDERLQRLKEIFEIYAERLSTLPGFSLVGFDIENGESPQWVDAIIEKRNELDSYLKGKGMGCRRFWFPLHRQVPYQQPDKDFPHSTSLSFKALWLPSAFFLSDDDVHSVCDTIQGFLRGNQR